MSIATDPNPDSLADSDDDFEKHFKEFADGKSPSSEEQIETGEPEGNDPEEKPAAPAEGDDKKPEAATEEDKPQASVTSGEAKPEGGSQPPEGEKAPDPWEGIPEEKLELIRQLERERDEARHKANSDANRVAALSRKLQQLTTAPASSATKAPEAEEPTEAQKALDEKIKQLRADYGEIADPLIELIEQQRSELKTVRSTLEGLSEQQQAQVIATEAAALEERHPDWRDIAQSPDFSGWLSYQPENIQRLASSWDARETSVVLTLFKAERAEASGQTQQATQQQTQPQKAEAATGARRSQQLEGGRDVRSRPAPAASEPPDDFDAAFKFFEEKRKVAASRR